MQPTVRQLEQTYNSQISFENLNVDTEPGKTLFGQLGLLGHPSYVIFLPGGREVFRTFGVVESTVLETALMDALEN